MNTPITAMLFLCENFILDINNNVSLINIFTGIKAEKLPATRQAFIYFHVRGIEGTHSVRFTVTSPEGQEKEIDSDSLNLKSKRELFHLANSIEHSFESKGVYIYKAFLDDEEVSKLYFDVEVDY